MGICVRNGINQAKTILSDTISLEELNERKKSRTVKSDETKIMLDIITFYTLYESREIQNVI